MTSALKEPQQQRAEPKLMHHVKKLLNLSANAPSPDVEYIINALRTQHREYTRRPMDRLRCQVELAVAELVASNRKRKAADDNEIEYDKAAEENESIRQSTGAGGGLNASLRNRYKQVQQERDMIEANNNKVETGDDAALAKGEATKKRRKVKIRKSNSMNSSGSAIDGSSVIMPVPRPSERYSDLGGMDAVITQIRQLVEYPLIRPELYRHLGVDPPRGVLLRGPPGTGKTHVANAVAGQLGVPYFRVSAPELVSGMSGESEGRIRDLFTAASEMAPSIIFVDELDAIAPKRSDAGGSRGMEKRMVAQLLTCLDMIAPKNNRNEAAVVVLGSTNRPDSLDPALRRAGRFDKEILLGVPDEAAREMILRSMLQDMRLSGDFDFKRLARKTPGYVGADLRSLAKEAAVIAINRIFRDVLSNPERNDTDEPSSDMPEVVASVSAQDEPVQPLTPEQMEPLYITMDDFLAAIPHVQPSSKREGFATLPDVSWDDVGALQPIREELTISVLEPIRNPEKFEALGLPLPAGVLLYGPPGCGKTLLAKAIAHESGANFISVKGPELLDKYVGESEKAVRLVFERARCSSPCIVFFDELDSLVPKRGSDGGGSGVSERVVNQLLTEMDGLESRRSVFVIAATNRPGLIDPAMMRPGRLDKMLYVPLPSPAERVSVLRALVKKIKLGDDVDLEEIGSSPRAEGYSGADCAALLREAGLAVLKEDAAAHRVADDANAAVPLVITRRHFDLAFSAVIPSVSEKDQQRYDRLRDKMARARTRVLSENKDDEDDDAIVAPNPSLADNGLPNHK